MAEKRAVSPPSITNEDEPTNSGCCRLKYHPSPRSDWGHQREHFHKRINGYEVGVCVHKAAIRMEVAVYLPPPSRRAHCPRSQVRSSRPVWRPLYQGYQSILKMGNAPCKVLCSWCIHTCPSRCPSWSHHSMCHTPILQASLFAGDCVGHLSPGEEEAW